jgi:hypothetical protein
VNDYNEDRAYELGLADGDDVVSEKEFAEMLRDRARPKLVTEEDLVNRAPNIYQGPLRNKPEGIPFWAALLGCLLFVGSVVYLVSCALQWWVLQ